MKSIVDVMDEDPNVKRIMINLYNTVKSNTLSMWINDFYKYCKKCKHFSVITRNKPKK